MPSKSTPFTPSSILFRPCDQGIAFVHWDDWVEPPGTAPGSERFIHDGHLSPYPACAAFPEYRGCSLTKKDHVGGGWLACG